MSENDWCTGRGSCEGIQVPYVFYVLCLGHFWLIEYLLFSWTVLQPSFFQQIPSVDLDSIEPLIICLEKQKMRLNGSGVVQTIYQPVSNAPCTFSCQGPVQLRGSCVPAMVIAGYRHCCNPVVFKWSRGNHGPCLILGWCSRTCGSKDMKELESHFGTSEMKNTYTSSVKRRQTALLSKLKLKSSLLSTTDCIVDTL